MSLGGVARGALASVALASAVLACGGPPAPSAAPASPRAAASSPARGADAPVRPALPGQRFAELGACPLESGETILDCRLGYRTFGTLDRTRSNAVLFPTYFTGSSADLVDVVVDKLVDTRRFYLILVDALGNGVSSSPSSSRAQPRLRFPQLTIADMVEAERRLVVDVLGIPRLHAVAGISMGGMQAFAWAVMHPTLARKVVSIAGTPKLTSSDMLLWSAELAAIEGDAAYRGGDYEGRPLLRAPVYIHALHLFTPAHRSRQTAPDAFAAFRDSIATEQRVDWNDWRRQAEAMMTHDVGRQHGGLAAAAARIQAELLAIVADQDLMVDPAPSKELAGLVGGELLRLEGDCGHAAPACEAERLGAAVRGFLAR